MVSADAADAADTQAVSADTFRTSTRHTWACLQPHTRRLLLITAAVAAVLAALDALAVGLVPTMIHRFQGSSGGSLGSIPLPLIGSIIVVLLISKSVAGAALVYWQSSFLAHDESERTIDLFTHFVERPYDSVTQTNTSVLLRDLQASVPMLYRAAAAGIGLVIVDGLSLIALILVVLIQSPVTGAALGVLALGAGFLYTLLIRKRVAVLGERLQRENADVLLHLTEGLGSVKTVKAFGAESMVIDRFARSRSRFAGPTRDFMVYQQVSRYYLEVALVVVLGGCIGVIYLSEGREAVFGTVGLISGVAARAMPALARLLVSITNVRVAGPTAATLHGDLQQLEGGLDTAPPSPTGATPATEVVEAHAIALDGVTFRYPGAPADALSNVSVEVRRGEIVAMMGSSGSGKTSLVDVLIGLLRPTRGTVRVPDTGAVGYVSQDTFVWDDGVLANVTLGRTPSSADDEEAVWSALRAAHLAEWVRSLPEPLTTPLGERGNRMSGGQRQRLGIARALYGQPSFLVLDEPTSSLDSATSRSILETLTELKKTVGIVVVTHDPLVVEYADRTLQLEDL